MSLIRCKSCRTKNDLDQAPTCSGCGRPLETTQARPRRTLLVQHEAARDGTHSGIALALLGILAIPSMVAMIRSLNTEDFGGAILFTFIGVLLVGAMIWIPLKRRISASRRDNVSKAISYTMAFFAALIGSGILVLFTCASFGR